MADLPGAEYAPVMAFTTDGIRPLNAEERLSWLMALAAMPSTRMVVRLDATLRPLSCTEPIEMREIWRLAAMVLGATVEQAQNVCLVYGLLSSQDLGWRLCLPIANIFGGNDLTATVWEQQAGPEEMDGKQATASLCLAVWGPK